LIISCRVRRAHHCVAVYLGAHGAPYKLLAFCHFDRKETKSHGAI